MVLKSSRLLTPSFTPPTHTQQEEEEFNEYDIVWSTTTEQPTPPISTTKTTSISATTTTTTAGLSAALLATEEPQSPTSFQRKTTSSPVSMIPSSFSRGNGPGNYYYGRKVHQSAPVNVPVWPTGFGRCSSRRAFGLARFDEDDDDGGFVEDEEMVPPHEIVARSQKTTSFSVIEGAGRTLKGRDLTAVRNAVFHKTGFLE